MTHASASPPPTAYVAGSHQGSRITTTRALALRKVERPAGLGEDEHRRNGQCKRRPGTLPFIDHRHQRRQGDQAEDHRSECGTRNASHVTDHQRTHEPEPHERAQRDVEHADHHDHREECRVCSERQPDAGIGLTEHGGSPDQVGRRSAKRPQTDRPREAPRTDTRLGGPHRVLVQVGGDLVLPAPRDVRIQSPGVGHRPAQDAARRPAEVGTGSDAHAITGLVTAIGADAARADALNAASPAPVTR